MPVKTVIKLKNGEMVFNLEAENCKSLFSVISEVYETFGQGPCGACGSDDIVPLARKADKYLYHELKCKECGAALGLGQKDDGVTLFPKRKDEDGNPLPNKGWTKWWENQEEGDKSKKGKK